MVEMKLMSYTLDNEKKLDEEQNHNNVILCFSINGVCLLGYFHFAGLNSILRM